MILRLVLLGVLACAAGAQDAPPASPPPSSPPPASGAENNALAQEVTEKSSRAVERGLRYIASEFQPDGSAGTGRYAKNVAITSLACLALMGEGSLPGRGRYGQELRRGLEFVLASSDENGLLAAESSHGTMYGHGFATLFLGEVYGMTQGGGDTELAERNHEVLVKAVRLIERTQNGEGGWRYNPVPHDADLSVTICQIMALRSARNAGIEVDKAVIDKAIAYVRRLRNPDGGFRYQAQLGTSLWPRSAAGVAALYYAGVYEDDAIEGGLAYVDRMAKPGQPHPQRAHYYYGHYYAVQAMYLAGGEHWARWWPAIRDELVSSQLPDGSWEDRAIGSAYATSMSLIILQMPNRYLPIFQR